MKMRWNKKVLLSVGLILGMVMTGCTKEAPVVPVNPSEVTQNNEQVEQAAYPITITDSTGTEITLTQEPQKVVSLAPSTTEILYFLGVEDKIVGRTSYCNFPATMQDVQDVGGTANPNIETIVALNPDLVVASTHVSDEIIQKLREVNIPIAFLNEQENFEGTYSAIEKIGLLVNRKEEANKVVEEMKQKVSDTIQKVEALGDATKPSVYYAVWYGDSDSTASGDTFIGEMITLAGGINVAQDATNWSISKEKIVEGDPDMIIVPGGVGLKEGFETTDFYKDLRAVKEGHIYEIDQDMISRQGPRVADAFVALAHIIHPEME